MAFDITGKSTAALATDCNGEALDASGSSLNRGSEPTAVAATGTTAG